MDAFNHLLSRQIAETLGENAQLPSSLQALMRQINNTYIKFEEDLRWAEAEVEHKTEQVMSTASNAYSFFDILRMGFVMCDVRPEVVVLNQTVQELLGKNRDIPVTQSSTWDIEAIDGLFRSQLDLLGLVKSCLKSTNSIERSNISFGKLILRLYIAPVLSKTEKNNMQPIGVVILVEDITEQTLLERARDEFFSIASHELRTPLTAIRTNSTMIMKYYKESINDKDVVELIDDIHSSAVRLVGIVNDFLDMSAMEQDRIKTDINDFAIQPVINEVVSDLQGVSKDKGILLTSDTPTSTSVVRSDIKRTKQVIYNLIGNAIKFTDKGSVTVGSRMVGDMVKVIVVDTGNGMSTESQRLLFRKFQQAGSSLLTRDAAKGTGLGLYISKLIIEQLGGKIWLENSEPGRGSTFSFTLPRGEAAVSVSYPSIPT